MIRMICRNRVEDYTRWKLVFDSHLDVHTRAGLAVEHLWRGLEDPNEVFFVFTVADIAKARAFLTAPEEEDAGRRAGVLDRTAWFVE